MTYDNLKATKNQGFTLFLRRLEDIVLEKPQGWSSWPALPPRSRLRANKRLVTINGVQYRKCKQNLATVNDFFVTCKVIFIWSFTMEVCRWWYNRIFTNIPSLLLKECYFNLTFSHKTVSISLQYEIR